MAAPPEIIQPQSLNDYLEIMSKAVFQSGMSWKVVENKWSGIQEAFQGFNEQFMIGVLVADLARGYPYQLVSSRTLVEDQLGDFPIMVWAKDEDYRVFLRVVGNQELHFVWEEGKLADLETGSLWNPQLGIAMEGEYKGQAL